MSDPDVLVRLVEAVGGQRGPFGLDWLSEETIKTLAALGTLVGGSVTFLQWITSGLRTDLKETREELDRTRDELHICQRDLATERGEVRRLQSEVDRLTRSERDQSEREMKMRQRIDMLEERSELLNQQLTGLIRAQGDDWERRRVDQGPPGGVERRRPRVIPDEGTDRDR